ncbi:MAG: T9SS type A sorting domain-containing protein [Bacteroidota bacterium]|nr:T9SS type A sorting domain-containing protein [Bacteroidota bacterium]
MLNNLRNLIILGLILSSLSIKASHAMGGYIEYKNLGQDSFEVSVTLYKDCKGVSIGSSITLDVEGIGCSYSKNYTLNKSKCADVTPVCKKSCSRCNRSSCDANGYPNGSNASCSFPYGVEKQIFKGVITFKNTNCCKFRLYYSIYARNGAITTCCSGESLYIYSELDRCTSPQNSSPAITSDPLAMVCKGNCTTYNMGIIDTVNQDSISYHLAKALYDYGSSCTYYGLYSYKQPLYYDGFPKTTQFDPKTCTGFELDSLNGDLKFNPQQQQVCVIAFDVKEWRKDSNCVAQLIGTTHIDFMLTVVANCTNRPPTLPQNPKVYGFAGDKICFNTIQSSDSDKKDTVKVSWNNSISAATFKTSYPNGGTKQQFDFCWQTSLADSSNKPYYFTAFASDDACPLQGRTARSYAVVVSKKPEVARQITGLGCGMIKLDAIPLNQNICNEKYTYAWNVNGVIYNGKNTQAAIKTGGNVYVLLSVSVNGCTANFYDTFYVQPFLNIDLGGDTSLCLGATYHIRASPSNGIPPYKYQWLQGNANDTLDNFTVTVQNKTSIVCKITDSVGCSNYDTVNIHLLTTPTPYIPDQRKCDGDIIYFDATTNNNNVKAYSWEDTLTGNIVSTSRYYQTNKSQYLHVSLIDTNGCVGDAYVNAFHNAPVKSSLASNNYQCEYDSILLATKGLDSAIWTKLGDSTIVYNGTNYTMKFDSTTTLVIFGYNTNASLTCSGYDTTIITVVPKPSILLTPIYYTCKGYNTTLSASGKQNYSYKWNTGDTTYNTKASLSGYYGVLATDTFGCKDTATTELKNFPSQSVSINIANDTLIANNSNFAIYDWYYNSNYDTTTNIPWRYITQTGDYTLKATDTNGCVVTANTLTIKTLKSGIYTVPNAYGIKVYPNPSTGIYIIETPFIINDIMIYDLTGRAINNTSANNKTIDLSAQPEGIYLLQINKNIWVKLGKL